MGYYDPIIVELVKLLPGWEFLGLDSDRFFGWDHHVIFYKLFTYQLLLYFLKSMYRCFLQGTRSHHHYF
jgi:hypothetical protein